jgi:hypothetical protein
MMVAVAMGMTSALAQTSRRAGARRATLSGGNLGQFASAGYTAYVLVEQL